MKKWTFLIVVCMAAVITTPAVAMQGHDSHGAHGSDMAGGTFKHKDSVDGLDAEFEVMSLASMNMTSDKGDTHHIMVTLAEAGSGEPVKEAVGKIKVIGPDGKEQVSPLENYSGILAANFTFNDQGKYGVICLVKSGEKKHVYKFWYHHM